LLVVCVYCCQYAIKDKVSRGEEGALLRVGVSWAHTFLVAHSAESGLSSTPSTYIFQFLN